MKNKSLIIFLSIFFTVYGAVNYYIFIRGYQGLEAVADFRPIYIVLFLIVSLSYIAAKFIERKTSNIFTDILSWIGSIWFAFILYFLLSLILLDILRLGAYIFNATIDSSENYPALKLWITLGLFAIITIALIMGYINAKNIKIKRFELMIDKPNHIANTLNIVMASDLHLGTIIGRKRSKKIVDAINLLRPDIILLAGDIIDSEVEPVVRRDLGAVLRELKATYGIYGVTGNHEYIGGVEAAVNYIRAHGIDLLRDEIRHVAGVTIIGREDYTIKNSRKTLSEMIEGIDPAMPLISMDHQPFHLEEAEVAKVDLQVSGHTHRGQLWPLNFITKKVYEIDWGYLKKGNSHFYVSSGVGTWGPPMKIGNDAEILQFVLKFN